MPLAATGRPALRGPFLAGRCRDDFIASLTLGRVQGLVGIRYGRVQAGALHQRRHADADGDVQRAAVGQHGDHRCHGCADAFRYLVGLLQAACPGRAGEFLATEARRHVGDASRVAQRACATVRSTASPTAWRRSGR